MLGGQGWSKELEGFAKCGGKTGVGMPLGQEGKRDACILSLGHLRKEGVREPVPVSQSGGGQWTFKSNEVLFLDLKLLSFLRCKILFQLSQIFNK